MTKKKSDKAIKVEVTMYDSTVSFDNVQDLIKQLKLQRRMRSQGLDQLEKMRKKDIANKETICVLRKSIKLFSSTIKDLQKACNSYGVETHMLYKTNATLEESFKALEKRFDTMLLIVHKLSDKV